MILGTTESYEEFDTQYVIGAFVEQELLGRAAHFLTPHSKW